MKRLRSTKLSEEEDEDTATKAREINQDIWRRVAWYLKREVPAPLSFPARKAVRQGDLVAIMKVCTVCVCSREIFCKGTG
jgi:hypothetical protein